MESKIIHQSWKTSELLSEQIPCMNSVKSILSNYEYKFWIDKDNDNFIETIYPEFKDFYATLNVIDKCDFVRYLYIHYYGGIYIDLDVTVLKNFDKLLTDDYDVFLCNQPKESKSLWVSDVILDPFILAGKKGSPFFYSLCQSIQRGNIFRLLSPDVKETHKTSPLYKTANIFLTKFYFIHGKNYKIKLLNEVFANSTTYECSSEKDKFYGIHLQTKTWLK